MESGLSRLSRSTARPWSGNSQRGKPPFATPGMQGVEQHWNKPSPRTLSPVWQMLQSGYGFQRPCSAPSSMISVLRSANDIGWGSGTVTGENQPTPLTKETTSPTHKVDQGPRCECYGDVSSITNRLGHANFGGDPASRESFTKKKQLPDNSIADCIMIGVHGRPPRIERGLLCGCLLAFPAALACDGRPCPKFCCHFGDFAAVRVLLQFGVQLFSGWSGVPNEKTENR